MSYTIGLSISPDTVRGMLIHRAFSTTTPRDPQREIVWDRCIPVTAETPLEGVLTELFSGIEIPRFVRLRVHVSLGAPWARVKHIRNLPTSTDGKLLSKIVRENVPRFFVRSESPRRLTGIRVVGPGEVFIGAIDADVIETIYAACETIGARLHLVAPSVVIQDDALDIPRNEPLVIRPSRDPWRRRSVPAWRIAVPTILLCGSILAAMLVPGLAARHDAQRATRELAGLTAAIRKTGETTADLDTITQDLNQIATFSRERTSIALLLGTFTRALPSESAITAIRVDSTTAEIVAVSSRVAAVVGALDATEGIVSPEIVGPVTRDLVGQRELERATIRMRLTPLTTTSQAMGPFRFASEAP